MVKPGGRVLGVDLIPSMPPKGVSAIQGDFRSEEVRREVERWVRDVDRGRLRTGGGVLLGSKGEAEGEGIGGGKVMGDELGMQEGRGKVMLGEGAGHGYLERERMDSATEEEDEDNEARGEDGMKCIDVVLSDMSAPWDLLDGLYKRTLSNPYYRLMNTSGNNFRDHAGSMVCPSSYISCLNQALLPLLLWMAAVCEY
jgi:21S rRNA (uridine2791-2'-O)-methyltransferase